MVSLHSDVLYWSDKHIGRTNIMSLVFSVASLALKQDADYCYSI